MDRLLFRPRPDIFLRCTRSAGDLRDLHLAVLPQRAGGRIGGGDGGPGSLAGHEGPELVGNGLAVHDAVIKALYEKEWEGIIGNCDTLLFLGGGSEPTSLEFMSKLLGKETLDTRTRGLTKGQHGSSSTNYQQAGRELVMIDEIRMMDTDDAILLIRGEKPVLDQKYDITRHPNFKKSAAGGEKPYVHKPQETLDYALPDLPYEFHALDDYEFIDMEDSQNEQEE